jgi:hypothetical protein
LVGACQDPEVWVQVPGSGTWMVAPVGIGGIGQRISNFDYQDRR